MDKKFLNKIRNLLQRHKDSLVEWFKNGSSPKNLYFGLDEDQVARSSKNLEMISKIDHALDQVENGTFGKCELCSGEVEEERLILDFTTCVCLDHYTPEQLRELEQDLEMAAKVQRHLLPSGLPALGGVEMAVMARPAGAVGGDYYDFFRYKEQCQGFAIADVMGKGVQAGMLMANLQASLRIMGPEYSELPQLATRLNKLFRFNLRQIRFITMFLAGFDPDTREMHYINAGHHPPLLWNAISNTHRWLKPTGPAIGLVPEASYKSETLKFEAGDMLVMYTDGLVEARNGDKKEFGQDGLVQYTSYNYTKPPETFVNGLLSEIETFGAKIRDDLTLMVLKMA